MTLAHPPREGPYTRGFEEKRGGAAIVEWHRGVLENVADALTSAGVLAPWREKTPVGSEPRFTKVRSLGI